MAPRVQTPGKHGREEPVAGALAVPEAAGAQPFFKILSQSGDPITSPILCQPAREMEG